jgi:hypothetical protein
MDSVWLKNIGHMGSGLVGPDEFWNVSVLVAG